MKNEDFDDAIREKLDSLGQTFTEGDIDNVFHHVKKHNGFVWKGIRSSWLLYSLSAAAFVGMVIWQINRFSPKHTSINKSTDTSTLTQKAIASVYSDSTTITIRNNSSAVKTTKINTQISKNSSVKTTKSKLGNYKTDSTAAFTKQVTENNTDVSQNHSVQVLYKPETVLSSESFQDIELQETELNNSNTIMNKQLDLETPVESTLSPDTLPQVSTLIGNFEQQSTPKWNLTKLLSVSEFRIKSGIALSKYSIAPGIAGDFLLKNNFSFSLGLQYAIADIERFDDKRDLDKKRPQGKDHPFGHHISDKDHVVDIQISSKILQLPVSVSYNFPIRNYFTANVSLGSNLDLYLHQDFKFKSREIDSLKFEPHVFSASDKVIPFNNIVISAGVGKSWRQFTIQVEPFIAPKINKLIYKPREMDYGVGIKLFYSFKKN